LISRPTRKKNRVMNPWFTHSTYERVIEWSPTPTVRWWCHHVR